MNRFLFIASGLALSLLSGQAQAQNVIRDYVLDKNADYHPDDHVNRGIIYRLQTGNSGALKGCDDDLNKMYSPYINWNCRPGSPPRPMSNFVSDFNRKLTRFRDGAGDWAIQSTESCDLGLIAYDSVDSERQRASDQVGPEKVSQTELQLTEKSQGSTVPPLDDLSAERLEQLRIQRKHR